MSADEDRLGAYLEKARNAPMEPAPRYDLEEEPDTYARRASQEWLVALAIRKKPLDEILVRV